MVELCGAPGAAHTAAAGAVAGGARRPARRHITCYARKHTHMRHGNRSHAMDPEKLYTRYQELQRYVGWSAEDTVRVQSVAAGLDPVLPALVDDFYEEIDRHPGARKVITGG